MQFSIQKLPKTEREIKIEISTEEFKGFLERATFLLGENLEIKGFRRGKAPKEIIEKEIGLEKILKEAGEIAIKESCRRIISENKIEAIGQPLVEILKLAPGNPFQFKVKVAVLPEIKLPDYKKVVLQMPQKEVFLLPEEIEKLKREKERAEREKWRQKVLEKITQESDLEVPGVLIEEEKKRILEETKKQISLILQISFENYLQKIGKNEKELLDSFSPEAEKRVKNFLVLREIGKLEEINTSEEEIQEEMEKVLKNYPAPDEFDRERLKGYTKEVIKNEKTFQRLEDFLTQKSKN